MQDAIHLVRARVICAIEYLTRLRAALPVTLPADSAAAMTGVEVALRQALLDLPDRASAEGDRRQESRPLMESVMIDDVQPRPSLDAPLRLDLRLQVSGKDGATAFATSRGY